MIALSKFFKILVAWHRNLVLEIILVLLRKRWSVQSLVRRGQEREE
jgi:hypothetical protein